MALHEQILSTLSQAAKKRLEDAKYRQLAHRKRLCAKSYHKLRARLNNTTFLAPIDARTTQANIYYMKKRFMRFCREKKHGPWEKAIRSQYCDKGLIMTFLRWICETYLQPRRKRSKKRTVNQYWRDFKMLYRRANDGRVVNANDCEEIRKYIDRTLQRKFNLDVFGKCKPVMGVDDLLLGLTHHWARDTSIFPTEDDRLDLPTIMLLQAYSACRPAELVDATKSRGCENPLLDDTDDDGSAVETTAKLNKEPGRSKLTPESQDITQTSELQKDDSDSASEVLSSIFEHDDYDSDASSNTRYSVSTVGDKDEILKQVDVEILPDPDEIRRYKCLCYEDILLWMVKDPTGERDVLAMEVRFHHHKGEDKKPKPTVFLFRENPLPILCPISHILARAIRDDAFQVDDLNHAKPFFCSDIGKKAVRIHWRPSILKKPVFRRSVRTAAGWVKSPTEPMRYSTYAFYLDRIGWDLGSEEKWTTYCMRRGNCNAILGVAPDGVVDQVMRHDPMTGCVQNSYLNHRVGFNTQDAFLERDPSADGLTKAFTHMSIRCNPEIPRYIPAAELEKLPLDPKITSLRQRVEQLSAHLKSKYKFISAAPTNDQRRYKTLRRDLKKTEKAFKDDMTKVFREACRQRLHNEELEQQIRGMPKEERVHPTVQHHLKQRNMLASMMCDFRDDLSAQQMTDRKIYIVDLLVGLASQREVRRTSSGGSQPDLEKTDPKASKKESTEEKVPIVLGKTQCVYCAGNEQLPYTDRMRAFKRVSHMMDHVENVHLKHEPTGSNLSCPHPQCKHLERFLVSLDHLKTHVQLVHGIKLRERRYMP